MSQFTLRDCKNERGAAVVELSLSLILFLFIAFAVVEFGSMLNERNALTQVAREGASLASRNLTTQQNMLDLIESTDNALDFSDQSKFALFVAQITAGNAGNPNPVCNVAQRGTLSNGVIPPAPPNCDLPANLVNYVTFDAGSGVAPIQQFTVVKIYYQHDPITPFGGFSVLSGGTDPGSTVMFSEAIF